MKKISCVLLVLMMLLTQVSCSPADETKENFSNGSGVTQIGDNLYLRVGSGYLLANSVLPRLCGLCRDPLCTHEGTETECLQNRLFTVLGMATDGKKLYMTAHSLIAFYKNPLRENQDLCGIYSYDPLSGELRHMADARYTSHLGNIIGCADGYVYYTSAAYLPKENGEIDRSSEREYEILWRVSTDGGSAEQITDEKFFGTHGFCVDKENIYVYHPAVNSENKNILTVIRIKDGEHTDHTLPGLQISSAYVYRGTLYLKITEETANQEIPGCPDETVRVNRGALYSFRKGTAEKLIDGMGEDFALSEGKIIYRKSSELHFHGIHNDGIEKIPLYSDAEDGLYVYDIDEKTTEIWSCAGDYFPYGLSAGQIIARRRTYAVTGEEAAWQDDYVCLSRGADGRVSASVIEREKTSEN